MEAGELTSQLASARADLQRSKVLLTLQAKQVERNRRLAEIGAAPMKDYEQSSAEYQALEENARALEGITSGLSTRLRRFGGSNTNPNMPVITAINAPFDGIVIKSTASPGGVVEPGTERSRWPTSRAFGCRLRCTKKISDASNSANRR